MIETNTFFTFNNLLYLLGEDNVFYELMNDDFILSDNNCLPRLSIDDKVLIAENKLIVINSIDLNIFSIQDNFDKILNQKFDKGINLIDTAVYDEFVIVYLNDDSRFVLNLKELSIKEIVSSGVVFCTNGKYSIEFDVENRNAIVFREDEYHNKIYLNDYYLDSVTNKERIITIEKFLNTPQKDNYVLQSKYDFIYNISVRNKNFQIQKIVIKNAYLGDTIFVNTDCYHITNQNIYKINWDFNKSQPLLNWAELLDNNDYSGIVILQVYDNTIVFLATKSGTVVFYSTLLNRIIKHNVINKPFYVNCKSIIFKGKLYLIDYENSLHSVSIPKKPTINS